MTLAAQIKQLHRPSLQRAPIPSIFQDAPACTECRKAHPCPSYRLADSQHIFK